MAEIGKVHVPILEYLAIKFLLYATWSDKTGLIVILKHRNYGFRNSVCCT